jgi:hypothetical protein
MIRHLLLVGASCALASCAADTVSVANLAADRAALSGKTVRIDGRIDTDCDIMGCNIASLDGSARLSLAYGTPVEQAIQAAGGRRVILEAQATANCGDDEICTDRAPEIVPIRIVRYLD